MFYDEIAEAIRRKRLDAEAGAGGGAGGGGAGAGAGASGGTSSGGDGGSADSGDTGSSDSAPTSDAPVSRGFGFYGIGTYSPGRKKKKKKKKKSFAYGKGIYEAISEPIVAKCELEHTEGKIGVGHFLFKQEPGKPILLVGRVTGLAPGKHGFHIHEFGDLSDGCKSAGGHYNPDGVDHGDIDKGHAGDLGNIVADENGTAEVRLVLKRVDLFGDRNIIGRAIVVHADEDDLGKGGDEESLKTGNAGDRLGCGVIRLATLNETIEAAQDLNSLLKGIDADLKQRKKDLKKLPKKSIYKENFADGLPQEVEQFVSKLVPTDVGVDTVGDYVVHFEGFTDQCNDGYDDDSIQDVYAEVYQDFDDRQGQKALIRGVAYYDLCVDCNPVLYSVYKKIDENFADGKKKGKSRPGRVKKAGASCKGSVSSLRAKAKKYSGERGKMYHWCANMKAGRNK